MAAAAKGEAAVEDAAIAIITEIEEGMAVADVSHLSHSQEYILLMQSQEPAAVKSHKNTILHLKKYKKTVHIHELVCTVFSVFLFRFYFFPK